MLKIHNLKAGIGDKQILTGVNLEVKAGEVHAIMGPNGSGKTTIFKKFRRKKYIHTEIYVNADSIELQLKKKRKFYFNAYRVKTDNATLRHHIVQSGLFQTKINNKNFLAEFVITKGVLHISKKVTIKQIKNIKILSLSIAQMVLKYLWHKCLTLL